MAKYLEIGKIASTHGLKGEFNVDLWCDDAAFASGFKNMYLGADKKAIRILSCRGSGQRAIILADCADNIDAAKALAGKILYFDRSDAKLPAGRYFQSDLIGLKVADADTAEVYGVISDVMQTGANDVYELKRPSGETRLIPAIAQIVTEISLEKQQMLIRPIPGLLSDED